MKPNEEIYSFGRHSFAVHKQELMFSTISRVLVSSVDDVFGDFLRYLIAIII